MAVRSRCAIAPNNGGNGYPFEAKPIDLQAIDAGNERFFAMELTANR
jgi:hypothetical protein